MSWKVATWLEQAVQVQRAEVHERVAPGSPQPRLPYIRGLDGLRALAVLAVLLYHAGLPVYGGFLGVESFFVISGFLITALLLLDWQRFGHVRLAQFWWRRARRLLPALFVLLAGVLLLAALALPGDLPGLARDTLAALGYATNWYLIASGRSYFDAAERPPLLQHLWSLAIEEQFYLLWPLLFGAGMRWLRAGGLLVLILAGAALSIGLMAAGYEPGADPSRIYYGTDTRAAGLLLGGALALVWAPGRMPALARPGAGAALDVAGLLALAALVAAALTLNEQHPLLYRGGLTLVSLATAVAVAAAAHPGARMVPWLLELWPLRWVGLRSYSLYLWHWPIFMLTRPGVDLPYGGWPIQLARFALAFALAALSYRYIELPLRSGAPLRLWRALRQSAATQATAEGLAAAVAASRASWRKRTWCHRWAPPLAIVALALGTAYVGSDAALAAVRLADQEPARALAAPQTTPSTAAALVLERPTRAPAPASAPETAAPEDSARADTASPAAPTAPPGPSPASAATDRPAAAPTLTATTVQQTADPALAAELQGILDAAVADGYVPGAVLSVRLPDGATWSGASGLADRSSGAAMAPTTLIYIGSLSKLFTAVVVLQLVEEGALQLDAPVARWLPGLLPSGDVITVRQLLQHTSGLYDYLEDRQFVGQAYADPARVWAPKELVAYATRFPAGPRGSWDYSNTNFVVLGLLVSEVTGNPLAEELDRRIFTPLGLEQTFALPDDEPRGAIARGYSRGDDHAATSPTFAYGTAHIVASVEDLRRFGDALLAGDLLRPETREQIRTFVGGKGQYDMPSLEYGLALMRNRLPLGPAADGQERPAEAGRVLGHIGGFAGFRAALWYAPESDAMIALSLNQTTADPNDLAARVLDAILRSQGR